MELKVQESRVWRKAILDGKNKPTGETEIIRKEKARIVIISEQECEIMNGMHKDASLSGGVEYIYEIMKPKVVRKKKEEIKFVPTTTEPKTEKQC